tara:strand:+ start:1389 stop:1823 length:435 start_codon:yes stop_codon:yes gene_type:complete
MLKRIIGFLFILLFFSGCATWEKWNIGSDENSEPPPPPVTETAEPFDDIPVPSGFSRDNVKSWIYESGSGTVKVGRLFFSGWKKMRDVLPFYQNEMLNKGWTLINSIKTEKNHILNYEKEGWVSTIMLHSNIVSTFIEIQVGPK